MMRIKSFFGIILLLLATSVSAQQGRIRITGKVTDGETGESLMGASVLEKGTTNGTISQLNGDYNILVDGEESVLVFAFIGFTDQEVTVGNQRQIILYLNKVQNNWKK